MQTGNTDVVISLHAVAHNLSGDNGFFSNWNISSAGTKDGNRTGAFRQRLADNSDGAGSFVIFCQWESTFDGPVSFLAGARSKEVVVVLENCAGNLDDLCRGLAFAIDDFRKTFAQRTMSIHARKIELMCVERFELARGSGGLEFASFNGSEQLDKLWFVHTGTVAEPGAPVAEKIDGQRASLADSNRMTTFNNPFGELSSTGLPAGPATPSKLVKLGRVVLRKEKAHRGGKTVIVIHDFASQVTGAQIEIFAGKLKKACGCGGTVKDRTIEIQGDQPGKIRTLLAAEGFQVAGVM